MIPKPTEIRKRHYVVPSLTTDFASYYADRQLRLEEEENALSSAIIINQDLYKKQELMRDKYNEVLDTVFTRSMLQALVILNPYSCGVGNYDF